MSFIENPVNQAWTVLSASLTILSEFRIMVKSRAAPSRTSGRPADVRIVFRGIADNIKDALCSEFSESVQQHVCKRFSAESVRSAGKIHRSVVKGHGAYFFRRFDPFKSPYVGDYGLRRRKKYRFCEALDLFSKFDQCGFHKKFHPFFCLQSLQAHNIRKACQRIQAAGPAWLY